MSRLMLTADGAHEGAVFSNDDDATRVLAPHTVTVGVRVRALR